MLVSDYHSIFSPGIATHRRRGFSIRTVTANTAAAVCRERRVKRELTPTAERCRKELKVYATPLKSTSTSNTSYCV